MAAVDKVVTISDLVTVVIISDGMSPIVGTPFDQDINLLYIQNVKDMKRNFKPVITVLQGKGGKFTRQYKVSALPWPIEIPELPIALKLPGSPSSAPAGSASAPQTARATPEQRRPAEPSSATPVATPSSLASASQPTPQPVPNVVPTPPPPTAQPVVNVPAPASTPAPVPMTVPPAVLPQAAPPVASAPQSPAAATSLPAPERSPAPGPAAMADPPDSHIPPPVAMSQPSRPLAQPPGSPPAATASVAPNSPPREALAARNPTPPPPPSPSAPTFKPATPAPAAHSSLLSQATALVKSFGGGHRTVLLYGGVALLVVALGLIGLATRRSHGPARISLISQALNNRPQ